MSERTINFSFLLEMPIIVFLCSSLEVFIRILPQFICWKVGNALRKNGHRCKSCVKPIQSSMKNLSS